MDILVRERTGHHEHPARPGEARTWGLVAAAVVLGMLFLVGAFDRRDRLAVVADTPVIVQKVPERVLP